MLKVAYQIIFCLLILILAMLVAKHFGDFVTNPLVALLWLLLVLGVAWLVVKLLPVHWLMRSAEWQLMEVAYRVETGTVSRTRKGEEKLDLFRSLAHETQQIYTGPAQAGGHRFVGDLPKAPFHRENLLLINSQDNEMEKLSKRKAIVRLNAALLREVLYGSEQGYKSRVAKLSSDERAAVMSGVENLSKLNSKFVWIAAKVFRHPSSIIRWNPDLKGRKALDYLTRI